MTLRQRWTRDKDALEAESLEFQVAEAKLQAQSDLLATKQEVKRLEGELLRASSAIPYSLANITAKTLELNGLNEALGIAEKVFAVDFAEETAK